MAQKKSFEEWMEQMNRILIARHGIDYRDLPDIAYRDLYDAGVTANSAAAKAIRAAKEE